MLAGPGFSDEIGYSTFHGSTFETKWLVHDRPHAQRLRRWRTRGVGGAFRRSQELVRDHGWTVFGTVVAATLISLVAAIIFTSIAEAIAGGPILRIVFSTLASTFTAPVGALVAAILYYRLRELKGDGDPMMPPKLHQDA